MSDSSILVVNLWPANIFLPLGLTSLHDMEWIVGLMDEMEPAQKKRGPYKKKAPK